MAYALSAESKLRAMMLASRVNIARSVASIAPERLLAAAPIGLQLLTKRPSWLRQRLYNRTYVGHSSAGFIGRQPVW